MYKVHIIKKNAEKRSAAVEKGKRALKIRGNFVAMFDPGIAAFKPKNSVFCSMWRTRKVLKKRVITRFAAITHFLAVLELRGVEPF